MVKESAQNTEEKSVKTEDRNASASVEARTVNPRKQENETVVKEAEKQTDEDEVSEDEESQQVDDDEPRNDDEGKDEADAINTLKQAISEKEDKFIRLQAELENFKRRNAQEIKIRFKFAGQALALSMLPGLDNLERAIEQAKDEGNAQMKEFITGIEMVQQQFFEALKQHSIERIFPVNEPFDPNIHEAMGIIETDDVKPDHISQVFQAGYMYHDRVIRPAVVQVAKKKS